MRRAAPVGGRQVVTYGLPIRPWQDLYHLFMTLSWPRLFASYAGFFALFNLIFAAAYQLQPGDVANLNPAGYWGRFFFSVETLATVGYGDMHPQTVYAHIIASVEIFTGMMSLALITGMMFARFSRPTARILFARHAVVREFDGMRTLMLRAANERQNVIMEATAQLRLVRDEQTSEGYRIRRIYDLPLRRSEQPVFLYGWSLMHVIDEASPLAGETSESLMAGKAFLLLTIGGIDETTGQMLMSRQEYHPSSLRWDHSFADIFTTGEDGIDRFDYTKFHDVEPLSRPEAQSAPPG
ncbi:MAG: Inward rectifier potassium channel [Gammaproteobacteria bacterium]|nr:Inward rectifier potassium channel [Gammaproteobacteria bacterium]MDE2263055.1 Inward rectifier potassium channel [Gammaproteobacteria bacterium]